LRSRSWERHQRRRRRRRIILSAGFAVVLSAVLCGVTSVFVYRTNTAGPATPKAAVELLLRSMEQNSINEFEQALCKPKRYQAGAILREFNSGMVDSGQTLSDIKWRITKETKRSADDVRMDLDVTFAVVEKRDQSRVNRDFPMRVQAVNDRGWYICEIEILTL
jgi:hypothetical protein